MWLEGRELLHTMRIPNVNFVNSFNTHTVSLYVLEYLPYQLKTNSLLTKDDNFKQHQNISRTTSKNLDEVTLLATILLI